MKKGKQREMRERAGGGSWRSFEDIKKVRSEKKKGV